MSASPRSKTGGMLVLACVLTLTVGCATRSYVGTEVGGAHQRIDDVENQVETNQQRIDSQNRAIEGVGQTADQASQTAREALDRAIQAGKLAEGKLMFEAILSDDKVRFGFDRADLGDEANRALAAFAEQLKATDANVFIEIQGHTDATGSESYNLQLGQERAEAVRRTLNRDHALPLHRMSVISYGEAVPVADNGTRDGRARNRRVVLVVLK